TSSPSACLGCPAISGSTRTCRSTRYRPREELSRHSGMRRQAQTRNPEIWIEIPGSRYARPGMTGKEEAAMNFDDTPQEAEFRTTARKWIDANAPKEFEEELSKSSLGRIRLAKHDMVDVGKAWQKKKGENWIVNGQKIWTSGAHYSDYGLLITRTDPNVPKHKGLTMFFLDMKSKGVEVRPIKQANGMQEFNEVYFTDVVIPDHQRLG